MKIRYTLKEFQNMDGCPDDISELGYELIMAIQEAGYAYSHMSGIIRYKRKDEYVKDFYLKNGNKLDSNKALFKFIKEVIDED